ncbi:MAG: HAMP domain-containing histidine kinase [Myxococcales bacterium]|nr:HAMP domain-containing histidine kinase [Myxococcales bacterium]
MTSEPTEGGRPELEARLADALMRLQQLEETQNDLIHLVAHDMRSPLAVLLANVQFVLDDLAERGEQDAIEALEDMRTSGRRLAGMVDMLLDISRLEAGTATLSLAKHDLVRLVRESLRELQTPEARAIEVDSPDAVHAVCDEVLFRRVVDDLVSACIKRTRGRGVICVRVSPKGPRVVLTFSDDGADIPAEFLQKVLQKSGQLEAKRRGVTTSVGLVHAQLAAAAHGGSLQVEARPGQPGVSFVLELPVEPAVENTSKG